MIYQICAIGIQKKKIAELDDAISKYEAQINDTEDVIETRSLRWWIERRARELGYFYPDTDTLYPTDNSGGNG